MGFLLRSPLGRTLIAIRENERAGALPRHPVEQHIWLAFVISCGVLYPRRRALRPLNNFADRAACTTRNRAISSSWR